MRLASAVNLFGRIRMTVVDFMLTIANKGMVGGVKRYCLIIDINIERIIALVLMYNKHRRSRLPTIPYRNTAPPSATYASCRP